ncbi:MAG: nucleotidyltransferase domain-containing protein, partial [Armatimonadetes bacterium]|nr:nucleotidyltransferase domain-containing protein [Armatimonadota bacterium]
MAKLERRILIQALVVFGSRARNDHWKDSDVDLVIVSPAFQGMTRRDRIGL